MTILVTGSTATIGTKVINHLVSDSIGVRALIRSDKPTAFPEGVDRAMANCILAFNRAGEA